MRGIRNTDRSTRKFINIRDMEKWEIIDKIATNKRYQKSFNAIINDALDYGLPLLYQAVFGEEIALDKSAKPIRDNRRAMTVEQADEMISDLKQLMVNSNICKGILCSLFGVKEEELNHRIPLAADFTDGLYQSTPYFLLGYETSKLKKLK